MFSSIDKKLNILKNSRPLSEAEIKALREQFLVEFTYETNAIEGSTITLDETYAIINDRITIAGKPARDYLDTINHADAFEYLVSIVKENYEFDERLVKELHAIVLANNRENKGKYRNVPVRVGSHNPPEPYLIQEEITKLFKHYNNELNDRHIVESIAIFHLMFENIHPFIDGNGRTGRLLINFELMKNGYPPINVKFTDREKYYDCFKDFDLKKEPSKMVELIKTYVEESLDEYLSIINTRDFMESMEYKQNSTNNELER